MCFKAMYVKMNVTQGITKMVVKFAVLVLLRIAHNVSLQEFIVQNANLIWLFKIMSVKLNVIQNITKMRMEPANLVLILIVIYVF